MPIIGNPTIAEILNVPLPVLSNVYENKSLRVRLTAAGSHPVIGPARFDVEDVNLRLSSPDTVQTGANGVIGGTAPPNTGLRLHLFRILNLASLAGKEIISADFKILYQNTSASSNPTQTGPIQLHVVSTANAGWAPPTSTWNSKLTTGPVAWAGSGGLRTVTTDYDAAVMGSEPYWIYSGAPAPGWITFDLNLTELAKMIADPTRGMKAKLQNENQAYGSFVVFHTDDDPDPSKRPHALISVKPPALAGVDMSLVTEIVMTAIGTGCTYANDTTATPDDFPLPNGVPVIEKLNTNGVASWSIYVADGAVAIYKFRGPIAPTP